VLFIDVGSGNVTSSIVEIDDLIMEVRSLEGCTHRGGIEREEDRRYRKRGR
jgi:molecular chaperone DnaK (HSP70)